MPRQTPMTTAAAMAATATIIAMSAPSSVSCARPRLSVTVRCSATTWSSSANVVVRTASTTGLIRAESACAARAAAASSRLRSAICGSATPVSQAW